MSREYKPELLQPIDPKSVGCALAWVRLFLRDKPDEQGNYPETGLQDDEYQSLLVLNAASDGSTTYYRPHVTAGQIIKSDPYRVKTFNVDGFIKSVRDADDVAEQWAEAGAAFDRLIPSALLGNVESEILVLGC